MTLPFDLKPCAKCGETGGKTVKIHNGTATCRKCGTETPVRDRLKPIEGGTFLDDLRDGPCICGGHVAPLKGIDKVMRCPDCRQHYIDLANPPDWRDVREVYMAMGIPLAAGQMVPLMVRPCPNCGQVDMTHLRSDNMAQGKSNKYFCPNCDAEVRIIIPPSA